MSNITAMNVVQYCSSLGRACGIATYTEMLSEAQHLPCVRSVEDLEKILPTPTHVHVQHEFGITPLSELRAIQQYCRRVGALFCVTLHSIVPLPSTLTYINFRAERSFGKPTEPTNTRWIWTEEYPDYDAGSFIRFKRAQRFIIENADILIVHCEEAKEALERMGAMRVAVIDHALERFRTSKRLFSERDGLLHVGCFGFLKPHKSIVELMEAIERIPHAVMHLYASIAHNDQQNSYVRQVMERAERMGRILIDTSHLPLDTVIYQLSKCDVNAWYCTPPGAVSTSGSIRQYLAAERPIVAADNVMISDIKHLVHAVPHGDINALVYALTHYANNVDAIRSYNASHEWSMVKTPYHRQKGAAHATV